MSDERLRLENSIEILGEGSKTIVFAHGFGLNKDSWRKVSGRFAGEYRIVLFDLVGFVEEGAEHYNHHKYQDLEAYADDVLDIVRKTISGKCIFVGHSVSGMIGVLASIKMPALFEKLILVGASPCYRNFEDYTGGFDEDTLSGLFDMMSDHYVEWTQTFAPAVISRPIDHPAVQRFMEGLLSLRPDVALSVALVIFSSDYRDRLGLVTVPCRIIQAGSDIAVPLSVAEYMTARIAGSSMEVIGAEGHIPQLSAPEILGDAISRALAG